MPKNLQAITNAAKLLKALSDEYSRAKIALRYSNPLELLIAVMLSAQCTDKQVNKVTQGLFNKYKSAADFASANMKELERDIYSTGFYRNKAANIKKACQIIIRDFKGNVPETMDEILKLPGVARKTANVVLGNAFGVTEGIAVDTHVKRLAFRLGITRNKDPKKIEKDLMHLIPKEQWLSVTYLLIEHGRAICKAQFPFCSKCSIKTSCPRNGVLDSK